ncbi:hypothetical protein IMZ48_38285 [Candidatus Bathyarchaeota archaeon]|nr:hypothetical protein [Candidatus Bathyarchaeota archaeon]
MYYTGSGNGKADLDCETSETVVNDMWKMGSKEDFSSAKKDCKKTDVYVELESMDATG